eukprot:TRINITY_DN18412_c0_g1_i2.p1 TRINITY_DN18412_c0_g1~~TRINITY_DN18412_c0_g1_i2.p1  ORF type:complete len:169 (-),score=2.79 TRINITY_DN18412_c0_g1_i2:178-684(-)
MWFGVDKGVYCYNGKDWKLFSRENSIIVGPIKVLVKTSDNRILAGSTNALYEYKNNSWKVLIEGSNRLHINVSSIKDIANGCIIVGINQGILIFKGSQRIFISSKNYFSSFKQQYPDLKLIELPQEIVIQNQYPRVDDIIEYTSGNIWALFSERTHVLCVDTLSLIHI